MPTDNAQRASATAPPPGQNEEDAALEDALLQAAIEDAQAADAEAQAPQAPQGQPSHPAGQRTLSDLIVGDQTPAPTGDVMSRIRESSKGLIGHAGDIVGPVTAGAPERAQQLARGVFNAGSAFGGGVMEGGFQMKDLAASGIDYALGTDLSGGPKSSFRLASEEETRRAAAAAGLAGSFSEGLGQFTAGLIGLGKLAWVPWSQGTTMGQSMRLRGLSQTATSP